MTDPVLFFLAVLTLLATPGPTNTVMATAGAAAAGRSAWPLLAAELLGYLSIITLSRLALLPLIEIYPPLGWVLKLLVVAYLIYAAIKLWRDRIALGQGSAAIGPRLVFVTTLLNPKGLVLAVSVFPRDHPMLLAYFAGFAVVVLCAGFAWFSFGRGLANLAGKRAALLPRVAAVALVGFAGLLAISVAR